MLWVIGLAWLAAIVLICLFFHASKKVSGEA